MVGSSLLTNALQLAFLAGGLCGFCRVEIPALFEIYQKGGQGAFWRAALRAAAARHTVGAVNFPMLGAC